MIVEDKDVEEAITFLSSTDLKFAQLKYQMEAMNTKKDLTEKECFLHFDGNVEERKASARTHENTKQAQRDYLAAMREFEKLKNERSTAEISIWVWKAQQRSGNANV